jgi:hypothetical protein
LVLEQYSVLEARSPYIDHIEWVAGLSDVDVQQGTSWLQSIAETAVRAK